LLGLAQGDECMFGMLYDKYHHALYLNVIKLVHDPAEAEDIVQDAFLTLWSKRAQIDVERPVGGWLFTVSYNLSLDLLKKKLRQHAFMRVAANIETDGKGREFQEFQWSLLEEAISHLSPKKKKAFQLCKLEGKSYEEASIELGISKYTINEYLKEGMAFIREYVRQKTSFQPLTNLDILAVVLTACFFIKEI